MKTIFVLAIFLTLQPRANAEDPAEIVSSALLPSMAERRAPDPGKSTDVEDGVISIPTGGTSGFSRLLSITPKCPCGRLDIPRFDRWAGDLKSEKANTASHLLLGLAIGLPFLLAGTDEQADFAEDSVTFAETIALTFAVTEVTKRLADRPRPYVYGKTTGPALADTDSYKSFFSGHASASFAVAAAYARTSASRNPDAHRGVANGVVFGIAGTTGALRVFAGRHFLSDVLTGAAAGALIGWVVPGLH